MNDNGMRHVVACARWFAIMVAVLLVAMLVCILL